MALGFGFNKQKILAQAEKFVQQGKLQNAIAEYEKVVKEDPKDLTVLGLIGDFHARVGSNDKASYYFKRVGDIYATEGFTVKAIAVYKKITKLNPNNTECITRLAELYTQQGLYNDARQQYVAVADHCMKANQLEDAARIFQKILELDSENTAMQSKLADLYIKLGRKEDARNIFLTAAQSLYNRGALDAADEALKKVISLDPHNQEAALLRGRIASDSGDSTTAIASLNKVSDLDSRPEALRSLMIAHLQAGKYDEAEPLARKLLSVHNDPSGLATLADTLMKAGEVESALKIYNEYSDRFLASGAAALVETLAGSISRIKENATALELARGILVKANAHAHINEVSELLAHAWVQSGELQKAGEIYKELSLLEPENPLHLQNYKQIQGKLGKDPTVREMSKEDGAQALMVDELELESPPLETHYLDSVNEAVKAAVTEAELFESYNMPHKALGPLESALQKAPRDSQLNQKLAVLYARSGRMEEAIRCCTVLRDIYTEAGHDREARRFGEMAEKYRGRSKAASAAASVEFDASFMPGGEIHTPPPTSASAATGDTSAVSGAGIPPSPAISPAASTGSVAEFNITPEIAASAQTAPENIAEFAIDVASGHSQAISQSALEEASQTGAPASAAPPSAREIDLSEWESMTSVEEPAPAAEAGVDTGPLIEEIRFFLSQSMWEESRSGIAKLESQAPAAPETADLRQEMEAGLAAAERAKAEAAAEKAREAAVEGKAKAEAAAAAAEKTKAAAAKAAPKKEKAEEPPAKVAAQPAAVTPEPVKPAASKIPPAKAPAAKPAAKKPAGLSDFVLDLDESLGEDFAFGGKPAASVPPPSAPAAAASSPSMSAAPSKAEPSSFRPPAQAGAASFANPEASSALSDMFAEFKEDVEEGSDDAEDPDTHYNLGVAFKEMGLLDEAIGELQKVCKAIDRGAPFTQVMQAYTWLAHCFLEKGTPEASVKWYERALKYASGDEESKLAVYYELGSAHEAAGNKKAALANFMEVYGSNIDYRDVADRIKVLKSQESVAVSGGDGPRA
jgi:pilus assembly protein FimV